MKDLKKHFKKVELANGMVRVNAQPHTKYIEALTDNCNGPKTGEYYFMSKAFGEDIDGVAVLSEIAKLQDTDCNSDTFGCLRWYREEPCIFDTNGAFFVLRYIACALKLFAEKITGQEREIILPVLRRAVVWFEKACTQHGPFYPNKIMSDGALLLLIGTVTENAEAINAARSFWDNWLSYTNELGWGWGENTSKGYLKIMVDALNLALICLEKKDNLFTKLLSKRNSLLDYDAYHGEYDYVPSIRTYNFKGTAKNETIYNGTLDIAHEILVRSAPGYTPVSSTETFHNEHIFDKSYASTYKGESIRLGTINKFPVMPGCYQNQDWGLGWQSMPVSALAKNHGVSFLRFVSMSDGKYYSHPAEDKHSAYLMNRLFKDENIPDCFTVSNQSQNTAVVVRGMYHVANNASYVADEWLVQNFDGKFLYYNNWYIFKYSDCVIAVKPLGNTAEVFKENTKIRIAQIMYQGEEKQIVKRKWLSVWAISVFDNAGNYKAELDALNTHYEVSKDLRFPREIHPITISCGDAKLSFDPDFDI